MNWPTPKVLAFSTTRHPPEANNSSTDTSALYQPNTFVQKLPTEFDFFNVGAHVGDCPISVERNRNTLSTLLPLGTKIQWFEQVHGNHVAVIDKYSPTSIVADAAITGEKNIALAIMTADCLPILLADKNGNEIAAIHAGWRPLAANIIEKTVSKMKTPIHDITAWLGPCISKVAFEVGQDVKSQFTNISEQFSSAFNPVTSSEDANFPSKYLADLLAISKIQLQALGIDDISYVGACTYTETNKYYSYRREGKTGRMATIIARV